MQRGGRKECQKDCKLNCCLWDRQLLTVVASAGNKSFAQIPRQALIFCRNVAIYFSMEDRHLLYEALADKLTPGGVLIISSTESLLGITERFERDKFHNAIFYKKIA